MAWWKDDKGKHSDTNKDRPANQTDMGPEARKELTEGVARAKIAKSADAPKVDRKVIKDE